jgi:hypothetical protein
VVPVAPEATVVDTVAAVVALVALVALVTAVEPIAVVISEALAALKALIPLPLTKAPDVIEVAPVPPFATGKVPVTPEVKGSPVTLVRVPDTGVPSSGVTRIGEVSVGLLLSALEATAVAIALNSTSNSEPLTIFSGFPEARESLLVKLVVFT